ncbi:transporter substrate-binding domain-containing protein [Oxalobacteraceae bacterium]|nr:transporter substrate-binding domain-containing protein [Oxalobacteraceae bacterium]
MTTLFAVRPGSSPLPLALWRLLLPLLLSGPSHADEAITVTYSDRPPYLLPPVNGSPPGGPPGGLTGTPAAAAFRSAGIAVNWLRLPTNRQLALVKEAIGQNCAVGWFHTPEREKYAKFTKPIYRDRDWVLLVNAGFEATPELTLEAVLQRKGTRVLVKDKYSYGPQIDALLARYQPTIAVSTGSTLQMLQSVNLGSVDLMFVSEDEGLYLMAGAAGQHKQVRLLRLREMPRGADRRIMCGRTVPDAIIERLNKAIVLK